MRLQVWVRVVRVQVQVLVEIQVRRERRVLRCEGPTGLAAAEAGGGLAWEAAVGVHVRVRVRLVVVVVVVVVAISRRHCGCRLGLFRSRGFRCLRDGADEPLPVVRTGATS